MDGRTGRVGVKPAQPSIVGFLSLEIARFDTLFPVKNVMQTGRIIWDKTMPEQRIGLEKAGQIGEQFFPESGFAQARISQNQIFSEFEDFVDGCAITAVAEIALMVEGIVHKIIKTHKIGLFFLLFDEGGFA
ncbi:MAG: hypothetical protein SFU85_05110 [Candidatus Methylacidiphilales bacterium]|nr:hypothetical protein [Candidatus Methylacidiphilales bacterium]